MVRQPDTSRYRGQSIFGEATPLYWENGAGYAKSGEFSLNAGIDALARIKTEIPDVKIVISLRNPIRRLISIYEKNWYHGKLSETLEDQIVGEIEGKRPVHLLKRMKYHNNLDRAFDLFGRERVQMMIFEEWTSDWGEDFNRLLHFLGAAPLATNEAPGNAPRNEATRYDKVNDGKPKIELSEKTKTILTEIAASETAECERLLNRRLPWEYKPTNPIL